MLALSSASWAGSSAGWAGLRRRARRARSFPDSGRRPRRGRRDRQRTCRPWTPPRLTRAAATLSGPKDRAVRDRRPAGPCPPDQPLDVRVALPAIAAGIIIEIGEGDFGLFRALPAGMERAFRATHGSDPGLGKLLSRRALPASTSICGLAISASRTIRSPSSDGRPETGLRPSAQHRRSRPRSPRIHGALLLSAHVFSCPFSTHFPTPWRYPAPEYSPECPAEVPPSPFGHSPAPACCCPEDCCVPQSQAQRGAGRLPDRRRSPSWYHANGLSLSRLTAVFSTCFASAKLLRFLRRDQRMAEHDRDHRHVGRVGDRLAKRRDGLAWVPAFEQDLPLQFQEERILRVGCQQGVGLRIGLYRDRRRDDRRRPGHNGPECSGRLGIEFDGLLRRDDSRPAWPSPAGTEPQAPDRSCGSRPDPSDRFRVSAAMRSLESGWVRL